MDLTIEADIVKIKSRPGGCAARMSYLIVELEDIDPDPLYDSASELDLKDLLCSLVDYHGKEAILKILENIK